MATECVSQRVWTVLCRMQTLQSHVPWICLEYCSFQCQPYRLVWVQSIAHRLLLPRCLRRKPAGLRILLLRRIWLTAVRLLLLLLRVGLLPILLLLLLLRAVWLLCKVSWAGAIWLLSIWR